MISKKMLSLLTAVAVSGGAAITAATVAPSVIASEQTMAELYEPLFPDSTIQGDEHGRVELESDQALPDGTQVFLTDFSDYGVINEVYFKIYDSYPSGKNIYFADWSGISPTGATAHVRVTIAYPDGSAEIITNKLTVIPPNNEAYSVAYEDTEVTVGTSYTLAPQQLNLPTGTTVVTVNTADLEALRTAGWTIDIISGTYLLIEAPESALGSEEIHLLVTYPDGTKSSSSVTVTATPVPEEAELHNVTYGDVAVTGGKSITVSPKETNLPAGTKITLGNNADLAAAGWDLSITTAGKLTAAAPKNADGEIFLELLIIYPDGSTETTMAQITATPAPQADIYEPSFTVTAEAGNTAKIEPQSANLPGGTRISEYPSYELEALWEAGGNISYSPSGEMHIQIPKAAVGSITLPLIIDYPDGSYDYSTATITVIPAKKSELHTVTYRSAHITGGNSTIITPNETNLPAGTEITLTVGESLTALHNAGWTFEVAQTGNVTATAPKNADGEIFLELLITYPDGSNETTTVALIATPLDAYIIDVTYDVAVIDAGTTSHVQPIDNDPAGNIFVSLIDGPELDSLIEAGWIIDGDTADGFFITAPKTATIGATIPVKVTYPDGSTETTSLTINVIAATKDSETHDVPYPITAIDGGTSVIISPVGTDHPESTKVSLSQDENLTNLRNAGWTFEVAQTGNVTATAPKNADGEIFLELLITYPDGSNETTTAAFIATRAPKDAETHQVTYTAKGIIAGEKITLSPSQSDLPSGTIITLIEGANLTALRNAGWIIKADSSGQLTATAPESADGKISVDLEVSYPDGTTEITTATITAKAKTVTPGAEEPTTENPKPTDPNLDDRPTADSSSFGSS